LGNLIKKITIATPFYNEEEGLKNFFFTLLLIKNLLDKLKIQSSFLFINDGSSDNTKRILQKFKFDNNFLDIKIIHHKKNFGYGRTLKTSFLHCKTNHLITYDSDCTYDYKLIKNLIESMSKDVDIVNVSYKLSQDKIDISFLRKILSWGASFIYKLFFREVKEYQIQVFTCSFRIYRLKKIKDIKIYSDDFNACAEIILKSILKKLNIKEIPGRNLGRKYGFSKMKVIKNIYNTIKTVLLVKFYY
jgi:glycosyltransferase involved in cell wall biosynthesis